MPHVENIKEMYDVISKDNLVEDFVAYPQEENIDKESFHASKIKRQPMIHLKVKYMKRTLVKTLMIRASKHLSLLLHMKARV